MSHLEELNMIEGNCAFGIWKYQANRVFLERTVKFNEILSVITGFPNNICKRLLFIQMKRHDILVWIICEQNYIIAHIYLKYASFSCREILFYWENFNSVVLENRFFLQRRHGKNGDFLIQAEY